MKKKMPANKKVLADYKRKGSTFIPPMTHKLGQMKSISYARQTLPELIWWDVLAEKVSPQFAIDVASAIGEHFKEQKEKHWWAFITDYRALNESEFENLKSHLDSKKILNPLQSALGDFLQLFPECPLALFLPDKPARARDNNYLKKFEERFDLLGDKRSRASVLMQAQAVYLGFAMDRLKVLKGLALADFPEVTNYPSTERSQQVGAAIRAQVNMMAGMMLPEYIDDSWVIYFWHRCFELRPFKYDHLEAK